MITLPETLTGWLLESPSPSIRYLTLRQLLDRPETDRDVEVAQAAIMTGGPGPAILTQQTPAGNWAGEHGYYTPKYTSTHWSMLLMAELAADGADPRLQRGVEFMLQDTLAWLTRALEQNEHGLACFWGNLLRYALHCGRGDDPRTQDITHYLIHEALGSCWRCKHNNELPCIWGCARALWGLAAIPAGERTAQMEAAIENGLAFILDAFDLVAADYPTPGKIHTLWQRLNFPLFYQVDILFVLRLLAELGALDHPRAQQALDWLRDRRTKAGRWRGASPYRSRTWPLGEQDDTHRWVSLQAAVVLQAAG